MQLSIEMDHQPQVARRSDQIHVIRPHRPRGQLLPNEPIREERPTLPHRSMAREIADPTINRHTGRIRPLVDSARNALRETPIAARQGTEIDIAVAEIYREPGERGAHLGEGVGLRAIHEAERGVEAQSADAAQLLPSHRTNAGEWLRFRCWGPSSNGTESRGMPTFRSYVHDTLS